jgi:hypothetical protein
MESASGFPIQIGRVAVPSASFRSRIYILLRGSNNKPSTVIRTSIVIKPYTIKVVLR